MWDDDKNFKVWRWKLTCHCLLFWSLISTIFILLMTLKTPKTSFLFFFLVLCLSFSINKSGDWQLSMKSYSCFCCCKTLILLHNNFGKKKTSKYNLNVLVKYFQQFIEISTGPSGVTTNKCIYTSSFHGKKNLGWLQKLKEDGCFSSIADQWGHFPSAPKSLGLLEVLLGLLLLHRNCL